MSRNNYIKQHLIENETSHKKEIHLLDWGGSRTIKFTYEDILSHEWEPTDFVNYFVCKCGYNINIDDSVWLQPASNISLSKPYSFDGTQKTIACKFSEEEHICHEIIT